MIDPQVGYLKDPIDCGKKGKLIYIACTPFYEAKGVAGFKDGTKIRKTCHFKSDTRQMKKKLMAEGKLTGKQFRRQLRESRKHKNDVPISGNTQKLLETT